jgi:chromatin remodeling complex protein RSC6
MLTGRELPQNPTIQFFYNMNATTVGTKSKRKINPAFMKPVQPDDKLSAVIGSSPLPRSEMMKKLWEYIRKHGLQDQQRKTIINADDNLRAVFGGKTQVTMFEMTKLVSAHVTS